MSIYSGCQIIKILSDIEQNIVKSCLSYLTVFITTYTGTDYSEIHSLVPIQNHFPSFLKQSCLSLTYLKEKFSNRQHCFHPQDLASNSLQLIVTFFFSGITSLHIKLSQHLSTTTQIEHTPLPCLESHLPTLQDYKLILHNTGYYPPSCSTHFSAMDPADPNCNQFSALEDFADAGEILAPDGWEDDLSMSSTSIPQTTPSNKSLLHRYKTTTVRKRKKTLKSKISKHASGITGKEACAREIVRLSLPAATKTSLSANRSGLPKDLLPVRHLLDEDSGLDPAARETDTLVASPSGTNSWSISPSTPTEMTLGAHLTQSSPSNRVDSDGIAQSTYTGAPIQQANQPQDQHSSVTEPLLQNLTSQKSASGFGRGGGLSRRTIHNKPSPVTLDLEPSKRQDTQTFATLILPNETAEMTKTFFTYRAQLTFG